MSIHRFRSMGCEIAVAGANVAQVEQLFHDYDRRFTLFRDDSELARVNRSTGPVLVSEPFAQALHAALRARRQTEGLVDPTLFDTDVRLTGRLLTTTARLDLNGVVKSLAVDHALALVADGWVSAGGDLATTRPVEVALPGGADSIRLERGALATSGTATRMHHLIDPRTGGPSDSPWEQVTACGATCLDADVAAKAAFLLGDAGPAWLDDHGIPGRFVAYDGDVTTNRSWPCT